MTERDVFALRWIGQQYAVRLDQLQQLLGQRPGHGAVHEGVISESATRDVVTRWRKAGWVCMERLRANQPPWIWLTRKGIHKVDLSYIYQDLHSLNTQERKHLSPSMRYGCKMAMLRREACGSANERCCKA